MYIHLESDTNIDPRVLRTRELLINSLAGLMHEHRSIHRISVQSITQKAGVNRVTFYAHFKDKYELLEVWARLMFQQAVAEKLPLMPALSTENLTVLIGATLEFFLERSHYKQRVNQQLESMFEATMQRELKHTLLTMLQNSHTVIAPTARDTVATFLSYSILGSALNWTHTDHRLPKSAITGQLVRMCEAVLIV